MPFDGTFQSRRSGLDFCFPVTGIKHDRLDIHSQVEWSVNMSFDVAVECIDFRPFPFSQRDQPKPIRDAEICRLEVAVGVTECSAGQQVACQPEVAGPEARRAAGFMTKIVQCAVFRSKSGTRFIIDRSKNSTFPVPAVTTRVS